ncbi:MAG: class I SAM-dependent RNA methyltransferase [Bacteroidota bacterium]
MATDYFSKTSKILITCNPSIPPYLSRELTELDYQTDKVDRLNVTTKGTLTDCIRLNYGLRTANRVFYKVGELKVNKIDDLYSELYTIPWEELIPAAGTFSVHSFVINDDVKDTRYPNLLAKDAVVDRIRKKTGSRPNSTSSRDFAGVYFYWTTDICEVFIDTSGETIAKHGYRENPFKAPLQEALASALLNETEWSEKERMINPMCGSGTFAIEAALKARNIAPGRFRKNWAFMHLVGFRKKILVDVTNAFRRNEIEVEGVNIWASDISKQAVEAARTNAEHAGVSEHIHFEVIDFRKTTVPNGDGVVFMNPEYGERLGKDKDLEELYSEIGAFLKQKCTNKRAFVFSGNLDLVKSIGLKPSSKKLFYNAKIECRLLEYELYEGSKKEKKN